jgi:hypothetical protein
VETGRASSLQPCSLACMGRLTNWNYLSEGAVGRQRPPRRFVSSALSCPPAAALNWMDPVLCAVVLKAPQIDSCRHSCIPTSESCTLQASIWAWSCPESTSSITTRAGISQFTALISNLFVSARVPLHTVPPAKVIDE